jgi:hypothetical protein
MSWVWQHSTAEGIERLVLLAIADQAGDDGAQAWPSVQRLASKTRVSVRTVQRAIRALEARGELAVQVNAGMRGANLYTVLIDPRHADTPTSPTPAPDPAHDADLDTDPGPAFGPGGAAGGGPGGGVGVTPVSRSPGQRDGVTAAACGGDSGVTRTVLNRPTTPQPPASGGPPGQCRRHRRPRTGCTGCARARTEQCAAERDRERRRSAAIFAELAAAKAAAVPRPTDLSLAEAAS